MPIQKFRGLLQQVIKDRSIERLSGPVEAADTLLRPESLEELDRHSKGGYALFVHDPGTDSAVQAYLDSNTAAADSGRSVMVLYESKQREQKPGVDHVGLGLGPILGSSPLLDFARQLFPDDAIAMPGIVILPRLSAPGNPLYFPLGAIHDAAELTGAIRRLLAVAAAHVEPATAVLDIDAVGRSLALDGSAYYRGARRSPGELMLVALRALWDARKDLLAVIGGGIKMAAGKKP